ncbi:hypothetical protein E2C01_048485 [Portunus trituberculatus]|uniref:Uncharacterized protein n=1 Tax=Portunus trituberculatus TaxID=210409 RepID=A0A5B7GB58_PORTR|nr:hypothetical protein [Portunus trituberculatus]
MRGAARRWRNRGGGRARGVGREITRGEGGWKRFYVGSGRRRSSAFPRAAVWGPSEESVLSLFPFPPPGEDELRPKYPGSSLHDPGRNVVSNFPRRKRSPVCVCGRGALRSAGRGGMGLKTLWRVLSLRILDPERRPSSTKVVEGGVAVVLMAGKVAVRWRRCLSGCCPDQPYTKLLASGRS